MEYPHPAKQRIQVYVFNLQACMSEFIISKFTSLLLFSRHFLTEYTRTKTNTRDARFFHVLFHNFLCFRALGRSLLVEFCQYIPAVGADRNLPVHRLDLFAEVMDLLYLRKRI